MGPIERILLIGFSGTGKSSVARRLAERLGWASIDIDTEIENSWGVSIPEIFRQHGEAAFRERERSILKEMISREQVVVATGGGAAAQPGVWSEDLLGSQHTLVVALDARPETILKRLQTQAAVQGITVERPMLASSDPEERIRGLKAERQASYDAAHLTISGDEIDVEAIAGEIVRVVQSLGGESLRVRLDAPSGSSDIFVAPGAMVKLGELTRERWPNARRAWIITDANVGPLHAPSAEQSLQAAGLTVNTMCVAPGEGSKSLGTASGLYDWLLRGGVERNEVLVALGGGVVGDLAGFVAATVLRGVGLIQAPTTLLAAVDSSVGGKTGINHEVGKNLIGAFWQPPLVIVDTNLLRTVPPRELRSGWAEIIKHAVIQTSTPGGERGDLIAFLMRNGDRLRRLEDPATAYLVWRNISLKAAVVAADEREAGIRAYLNFGHTLGHAIEAADYHLLHGEAIALGMRAAGELGAIEGTCCREDVSRLAEMIATFELPCSAPFEEGVVLDRLQSDKKRIAGRQRYILPRAGGGVVVKGDLRDEVVLEALRVVNSGANVA